jgi:hypothetical protein
MRASRLPETPVCCDHSTLSATVIARRYPRGLGSVANGGQEYAMDCRPADTESPAGSQNASRGTEIFSLDSSNLLSTQAPDGARAVNTAATGLPRIVLVSSPLIVKL